MHSHHDSSNAMKCSFPFFVVMYLKKTLTNVKLRTSLLDQTMWVNSSWPQNTFKVLWLKSYLCFNFFQTVDWKLSFFVGLMIAFSNVCNLSVMRGFSSDITRFQCCSIGNIHKEDYHKRFSLR